MAFNPQIINPLDFDESVAIGVDIPFNGNAVFKSNFQTQNAIKNNLINFFLTNVGERPLNPVFGGGLRDFIFEQISTDNLDFLKEGVSSKLTTYFPNIAIGNLEILRQEEYNIITIKLVYNVINTNISDALSIDFI